MIFRRFSRSFATYSRKILSADQIKLPKFQHEALKIKYDNGESVCIPLVWLRDHCRSSSSFNHSTNQRKSQAKDFFERAVLAERPSVSDVKLSLKWKDGLQTTFTPDQLIKWTGTERKVEMSELFTLWEGSAIAQIPKLSLETFEFSKFSELFFKYGFVVVEGIEASAEATEKFCRELCPIHDTYFGAFWTFSNQSKEIEHHEYHEDTAYSNEEIGPHTDGTYFNQTPGIQVFHCLQPAQRGGDTILVDAFAVAERLRRENPREFGILSKTKIEHHYLEGGADGDVLNSVARENPVIELDSKGLIKQIRFNPYDRAPMRGLNDSTDTAEKFVEFYEAYQLFSRLCHSPTNALSLSLRPGMVIFIDNFRVLHARTGFEGLREMCGCYLSRDNLTAKARPHLSEELRRFY